MGKEFVVERQRIERTRMRNRWFYVNSAIAGVGIAGWIAGETVWVLVALVIICALNVALPLNTHFRLRNALARDRAKDSARLATG